MTQEEGAQDESKTTTEQANSMSGSSNSVSTGRGSDSTSPSSSPPGGRHAEETVGPAVVIEMGSADSAGNARGPSCGLVRSLLPSNCRGSAEAFARCLHRRLTSLGGEDGAAERAAGTAMPRETSWLRPSSSARHMTTANNLIAGGTNHVLQSQPRHSPESDLFYDVELEQEEDEEEEEMIEDGAGSPAEEATAAELARLLVNCPDILKTCHHDGCHCSPSGSRAKTAAVATDAHHDSETNCVFVSPITGTPPDSDSSEAFFDPESSDADRLRSEQFFDPVSTSDSSEITSNTIDASARPKATRLNRHARSEGEVSGYRGCEDASSESSCSLPRRNPAIRENARKLRSGEQICSSEENSELNGRSSQETTTSPSHESLWSTFDDSTLSLQDDSPSKISRDSVVPRIHLPKSHSDSELPSNGIIAATASDRLNRWNEDGEVEEDEQSVDEVDFVRSNGPVNVSRIVDEHGDLAKNDRSCNHSENLISKTVNEEDGLIKSANVSLHNSSQLRVEDAITDDSDTDPSAYDSAVDIPDALESSSGSTTSEVNNVNNDEVKSNGTIDEAANDEVKLRIDDDNASNNRGEEKKLCLLLKKLGGNSATAQEEDTSPEQECQGGETEEEDRPQRVRRCSSLKTGKTPPGTPRRKKIVRFADKLGLDLADVRTFLDEIPRIPNSAYNDLIYDDAAFRQQDNGPECAGSADWCERRCSYQEDMIRRRSASSSSLPRKLDRMLVPLFQQPGGMANFLDVVRERRVCLENVLVQDPVTLAIQGTVRVINIDYHKSVHIRYTLNAWRNYSDLQATYVPNSCDGFSDKFTFILYCHTLAVGQRLEFAVRFQCKGAQYWDNNTGANYCFQCLPASSPTGYIPITADENRRSSWSPTFY
ncbi:dentin sialophosphoprotein isoform X2 [Ooceraea biroi]|uniref:dentin sialophosphoprotein isoform X2 n=1 Tax=Ooceraea biroi TaxID=2015173 RepID=UPI0005BE5A41|nr:dentin sialophosphoprotein isoform X2 [Ooceraea biroi]